MSKKVVRLLATRHSGFTREEISQATGLPLGGGLSNTLAALAESDFITSYSTTRAPVALNIYVLL